MIATIAARELRSLLSAPLGWVVLASTQFLLAWRFLQLVDEYQLHLEPLLIRVNSVMGVTDLVVVRFLGDPVLLMVLLAVVALMAMRIIAEERRSGTLALLFSSPVAAFEIILGKYLAAFGFVLVLIALWLLMPLSLLMGTPLDLPRLAAAALGLALFAAALLAMAAYVSTLTAQPGVAAVAAFVSGLVLMLLHYAGVVAEGGGVFAYLGSLSHYSELLQGTVSSSTVVYFLLLIVGFLGFAIRRLDALRVQS